MRRHGFQTALQDGGDGGRRRQELDERSSGIRRSGASGDARGKHCDFLDLGRQRSHIIYARHRKQFADLLEADLSISARHHGAHWLTCDSLALACNPQARK